MTLPAVTSARWVLLGHDGTERAAGTGGYPHIVLTFADGRVAWVTPEQKPLFYGYAAAVIGDPFWDETQWVMRGEPAPGHVFAGTTDDPQIVALVEAFWRAARAGSIEPKVVDVPRAD